MSQPLHGLGFAFEATDVSLLQERYQAKQVRFRNPLHVVRVFRYGLEFVGQPLIPRLEHEHVGETSRAGLLALAMPGWAADEHACVRPAACRSAWH